jgi:hypothetical protein
MTNEIDDYVDEEDIGEEDISEQDDEWIDLKIDNNYEIQVDEPHMIRKKSNKRIVKETFNRVNGYLQIKLSGKTCYKHTALASQFLGKPVSDKKLIVDHQDRDKLNNALSNLRWVSYNDNNRNQSSHMRVDYVFVDEIPDESIVVNDYRTRNGIHYFDDLYYYNDNFYWYNGREYRVLHINEHKNGSLSVNITDNDHKITSIYLSKFKRQYNLI